MNTAVCFARVRSCSLARSPSCALFRFATFLIPSNSVTLDDNPALSVFVVVLASVPSVVLKLLPYVCPVFALMLRFGRNASFDCATAALFSAAVFCACLMPVFWVSDSLSVGT